MIWKRSLSLGRLTIEGLMTIPPFAPEAEASRHYFIALRELRDQLEARVRRPPASAFDGHERRFPDRDRRGSDPGARGNGDLWRTPATQAGVRLY